MPKLPTAIQAQLDKAQAALNSAESQAGQTPAQGSSSEQAKQQQAPQPAASDVAPNAPQEPTNAKLKNPGQEPAPKDDEGSEYWKHRFDVIDGKYRKETSDLRAEIERLSRQVEEANQAKPVQDQSRKVKPADITDEEIDENFPEDQIDELGYDLLKSLVAMNRNAAALQSAHAVDPESAKRLEQMEKQFRVQQEEAFYNDLTRMVPTWAQVQDSPEWDAFLAERDELSDFTRATLFREAADQLNVQRVARFFQTFLSSRNQPRDSRSFEELVTPSPYAPNGQQQAGKTITYDEYLSRMSSLTKRGLSPAAIQKEAEQLKAMMKQGLVTEVPQPTG
jgi:hypothetical protein